MSGTIDAAVVAALSADGALLAAMPDGVWFDAAPAGATRFVLVSHFDARDVDGFGGRLIEENLYAVHAVAVASSGADMDAAEARIDAVLGDGTFPVAGFGLMAVYRDEPGRIRFTETDQIDASIRWLHRGAHYRIEVTPA